MTIRLLQLIAAGLLITATTACERQGPMERVGERSDQAVEDLAEGRNPLDTKGPGERAGEALDRAAESATDKH